MSEPIEARVEALEFVAALGLIAYVVHVQGSGWNRDTLPKLIKDLAAEKGVSVPSGDAWGVVEGIIETAAKMAGHDH